MKLGEFFIRKGIINQAQLEEALRAQLIFGGHLGTCLMELGFLEEHTLGEALAEVFNVGYAPPSLFENVPKAVISLLSTRLVEKHHAVPFEHAHRLLHVAMIDPKNLPALDEISFATGCKIRPWVSPEARIFQVMERYYDIPRRQRYIAVCQGMDGAQARQKAGADAPAGGALPRIASAYASSPYQASLAQVASHPQGQTQGPAPYAPAPRPPEPMPPPRQAPTALSAEPEEDAGGPPSSPAPSRANAAMQEFQSWRQGDRAPDEAAAGDRPATADKPGSAAKREREDANRDAGRSRAGGQPAFSDLLCNAESIEDLSRFALEDATRGLARCALLLVKSTTATLWCSRGMPWDQERRRSLSLSVTSDPLFELLLEREHYRGPAPEDVGLRSSFKSLALEVPEELMLVPGYVEDRLVIVLYGDGGVDGAISGETADYATSIKKLACALHVVMLKRKIRSLDQRPTTDSFRAA